MSSVEQVLRIKKALEAAKTGGYASELSTNSFTTNRGHKLEPGARFVSSRTLNVPDPANEDADAPKDNEEDEKEDIGIDAASLLQPISDPAELCNHPSVNEIFTNPFLRTLGQDMLDMAVQEKNTLTQINDLFAALLGDDDRAILPQVMGLIEELEPYPTPEPGKQAAPVNWDTEKFFEVPEIKTDPDLGLEHEEAEVLRSKLLVSQHLMEEYVRCIEEIRYGVMKTQRLRNDVVNWCREMNNEDYVKTYLDSQNNNDNAGLGDRPAKDFHQQHQPQPQPQNIQQDHSQQHSQQQTPQ